MPKGLKPVRRKLATGKVAVYWYHRATGKRLKADPETAEGLLEVRALDDKAKALQAAQQAAQRAEGTLLAIWMAYRGDVTSLAPDKRLGSPEWRRLKPRTRSDYQKVFDWLGKAAEKGVVATMTPPDIVKLRNRAGNEKGVRFGNYVVQVLRMLFGWGKLYGHCTDNPAAKVPALRKPTGARKVNRPWAPDEVAVYVTGGGDIGPAPFHLIVPFALGLFAGMREGDALIVTTKAEIANNLEWIAGKNGEECVAPITGPLRQVLNEAKAQRVRLLQDPKRKGKPVALQLAINSFGRPWTESGFRASFFKRLRALRDAGLVRPGCTFHGLRHTIASAAANDGRSERHIAAAIGDRSPAMAQIYARDADRLGAQAAILEAAQKRFANIDWKTPTENGQPMGLADAG